MTASAKMVCSIPGCNTDITMNGYQICPICDPDMEEVIKPGGKILTPLLCGKHFREHMATHQNQTGTSTKPTRACPNCGNSDFSGESCNQCGVSDPIGN